MTLTYFFFLVVFRVQYPLVDVAVCHPDGSLSHPGSNHRHHALTSPREVTADSPLSSSSIERLIKLSVMHDFVKSVCECFQKELCFLGLKVV